MAVINGLADDVDDGSAIFSDGGVFGFFLQQHQHMHLWYSIYSQHLVLEL